MIPQTELIFWSVTPIKPQEERLEQHLNITHRYHRFKYTTVGTCYILTNKFKTNQINSISLNYH